MSRAAGRTGAEIGHRRALGSRDLHHQERLLHGLAKRQVRV